MCALQDRVYYKHKGHRTAVCDCSKSKQSVTRMRAFVEPTREVVAKGELSTTTSPVVGGWSKTIGESSVIVSCQPGRVASEAST